MLLIHGLEAGPADMRRLEMACRASGIQTLIFDYPNDGPLVQSGKRLNADLKRFTRRYPKTRITIVAHSMGGLVARYCLEQADQSPDCVTDLVTLATPHHGSSLASIQPWIELVFSVFPSKWNLHNDGLGQAGDDLRPGSKFLENLNARPRQKGVRYHVAIGRKGFLTDQNARAVEKELETLMARAKLPQHERISVRQFVRSPELRTGLGDGAVTVRSATLKDVASTRQFDLDHREIYQLPGKAPEKSLVFSWILEVLDWDTSLKPPSR
jgi:pimeloyl-ACP methyl ester carboxylesterase